MKKFFYLACCMAVATACTNDELVQENVESVSRGITFDAGISQNVETRGQIDVVGSKGNFFWYAEQDRINVYADNVVAENTEYVTPVSDWTSTSICEGYPAATYKATKSAAKGQFTATDDDHMISFKDKNLVNFIATYPTTTEIFDVRLSDDEKTVAGVGLIFGEPNNVQEVNFNQVNAPMYSITTGVRNENYEAVGEKMNLDFTRPFPILMFTSNENNDVYNEYLGKLTSVAVETKGAEGLEATKIASTMKVAMTADGVFDPLFEGGFTSSSRAEIKLKNASLWDSEDKVFMSIFPVQRKDVVQEDETKKSFAENYTVTYDYEYVTLTKNLESSSNWNVAHQVYGIEELNIAEDFSYIVTKNNKLIVFSGTFSKVFNEKKTAVDWDNTDYDFEYFKEIISNVALTNEEMKSLKTFKNLEKLTLKENTSIPADVFDENLANKITDLTLPKVTSVETEKNVAFSSLVNLDLRSCKFDFDGAEVLFFNENVKGTLVTLNIETVKSLRPAFGYDRTIVFTNYASLQKVILNSEGVALTGMAFAGCGALETVTGVVDIMNAPNAFEGAAKGSNVPVINVANTVIPNYAFANSGIGQVLYDGKQVIPTEIGEYAFFNNKAIEMMDLSKATEIGRSAFNLASSFVGTADSETEKGVVTIIAKEVNDLILANTPVIRVQFKNATTLGNKILGNANSLKQVKFLKEIDSNCVSSAFDELSTEKVDLFVYLTQNKINGLQWNGVTFKSITKEDKVWGE